MAHDPQIHKAQALILRELLFNPSSSYTKMMKQVGLSSDHFNFHLKTLVSLGLAEKESKGLYVLTPKGKEYANKMDTDSNTIERQPKVAVLLSILKESEEGLQLLVQQRLKQPFYGFWGLPSGKIRWGEKVTETGTRELLEETGLQCKDIRFYGIHHKIDMSKESGELLEDKIFFEILCLNPEGQLKEDFEGGKNKWITQKGFRTLGKYFSGIDGEFRDRLHKEFRVEEKYYYYTKDEY